MRNMLVTILLWFALSSFAPAPPALLPATVARPVLSTVVTPRIRQECTEQLARQTSSPYLHEVVSDARGYPIGEVAAWSCSGNVGATIAEFNQRKAAMLR